MKVRVDADLCTGCEVCVGICPEMFEMKDDLAVAITPEAPSEQEDAVREAADSCPVEAIILEE